MLHVGPIGKSGDAGPRKGEVMERTIKAVLMIAIGLVTVLLRQTANRAGAAITRLLN